MSPEFRPPFVRIFSVAADRRLRCAFVIVAVLVLQSTADAEDYYVDCSLLTDGLGTADAPWNNLATPSAHTFMPGDVIAVKRGTTCAGMLAPRGSGEPGAPITIGTYGDGARPVIVAAERPAAIALFNQTHWVIRDLEANGGNPHGIHISGDAAATLSDFRISNVVVHDVGGVATTKQSGLIDISPARGADTVIDDVVIDGATVFNTEQWKGIHVGCINGIVPAGNPGRIIIRNSVASNIAGDGITIYACSNGLIENNVAHDIGLASSAAVGTPNAIWTWACADCVVQFNEGFRVHSPARDGGIFDIDWGSRNTTVQYNYGHDADGYCVGIFGAWNLSTTNSIVRYNICANNGRSDPYLQGDIYLKTWDGGSLDGVEIYNNTIYWNPAAPSPALSNRENALVGTAPLFFKNNIIVSSTGAFVSTDANLTLDHNLYWARDGAPAWEYGSGSWNSFTSFQSAALQEAHGLYADPLFTNTGDLLDRPLTAFTLRPDSPAIDRGLAIGSMTGRDFFEVLSPQGNAVDIGASEYQAVMNLIVNPSFELDLGTTQTPYGWSTWSRAGQDYADYTQAYADGDSQSYYGAHGVQQSSYDVFTYQVLTGLAAGNYQLTAWVKSSGGQSVAWMEVNAYGGAKRTVTIPATSTWTRVTLSDIAVTAGQARVGFYSIAEGGQWLAFDDVSFTQQLSGEFTPQLSGGPPPAANDPSNLIVNPSFESDLAATQTPSGWSTWSREGHDYADYTEPYVGAYSHNYYATHLGRSSAYDVFTYQVLPGLDAGRYQLTAWVRSSGGQSVAWMEVNAYGGMKRTISITASEVWTKVTLSDIFVTAGQARIGFYSIAEAGQWLQFDEISFVKQ
jgi:hypothetical protein